MIFDIMTQRGGIMEPMTYQTIMFRLLLSLAFAAFIGYEREKNRANAGLKTHMIVGVGATIIALIQQQIEYETFEMALHYPALLGTFRVDPSRLIAQVVSGIGFLGAGTIIVTKRNVSGLTTAASIWSVAAIGLAVGMGYTQVALSGFVVVFLILLIIKQLQKAHYNEMLVIQYVGGRDTLEEMNEVFKALSLEAKQTKHELNLFGNERIYSCTFEIHGDRNFEFSNIVSELAKLEKIVSIQSTNLE